MSQNHNDSLLHFNQIKFIHTCGQKLQMTDETVATACHVYHKFYSIYKPKDYEPELIATTALYLAGKVQEQHCKLRDVVNVSHRTLHPDEPPLDVGEKFWNLRDSITQCELFMLRVLQFKVHFEHPHKFILHYLQSLYHWMDLTTTNKIPLARIAMALVRDSYHSNMCLKYKPEDIATSLLYFTLQIYGLEVPHSKHASKPWWETLNEGADFSTMRDIVSELNDMYELQD